MTAAAFEIALSIYIEQQLTHGVGTKSAADLSLKHCTIILMMLCYAPVLAQMTYELLADMHHTCTRTFGLMCMQNKSGSWFTTAVVYVADGECSYLTYSEACEEAEVDDGSIT